MTTSNTRITKADAAPGILAQFQTQVTDIVNGLSQWYIGGTNNFLNNLPLGGYSVSSTSFGLTAPLKTGLTVSSEPDASALTDAKVLATQVELALRNAVVSLSNARQFLLQKYYLNLLFVPVLWYDSTTDTAPVGVKMGHLTDAYRIALGSVPTSPAPNVETNYPGDASNLDAYVSTLNATLSAHRTSTQNFTETWCHSACHSSCHGSRNRR